MRFFHEMIAPIGLRLPLSKILNLGLDFAEIFAKFVLLSGGNYSESSHFPRTYLPPEINSSPGGRYEFKKIVLQSL